MRKPSSIQLPPSAREMVRLAPKSTVRDSDAPTFVQTMRFAGRLAV